MPPPRQRQFRLTFDTTDVEEDFTLEELSRLTGIPVRALRLYRSKQVLAPPPLRGRVGYFRRHHVLQLRLVQLLADRGFPQRVIADLMATGRGRIAVFRILEWLSPGDDVISKLRIAVDSPELDALRRSSPEAFAALRALGLLRESGQTLHVSALSVAVANELLARRVGGDDIMTATVEAAHAGQRLLDLADRLCPDKDDEDARRDAAAYLGIVLTETLRMQLRERHTAAGATSEGKPGASSSSSGGPVS